MTTVYYQSEALTDSQIPILTHTFCRWYNAWEARDELHDVIKDKGRSKFYVHKCLSKYKGEIIEDTPKYFRCQMLQEINYHLIKNMATECFFQKLNLKVVEDKVDEKRSLRSKYRNDYLVEFKV